jgi:hypothetical protein
MFLGPGDHRDSVLAKPCGNLLGGADFIDWHRAFLYDFL